MTLDIRVLDGVRVIERLPSGVENEHDDLTPIQQKLLVVLALDAGKIVIDERLIPRIYGEDKDGYPKDPLNSIRQAITPIRPLVDGLLVRAKPGYRLDCTTDLKCAQADYARARTTDDPELARKHAQAALGMFKGDPLAVKKPTPYLLDLADRLRTEHDDILELLVEKCVETNDTAAALYVGLAHFDRLVLRERFVASICLALAAEGRTTDVAERFRQHHAERNQLGWPASARMKEVEDQLVVHGARVRDFAKTPATGPLPETAFVGRDVECRKLATAIDSNNSVLVTGESGIGKTTFIRQGERHANETGRTVVGVVASANPGRPFDVVAAILEQLDQMGFGEWSNDFDNVASAAVASLMGKLPAHRTIRRDDILEEVPGSIGRAAKRHNLMFVIDDAHNLDRLSKPLIEKLIGTNDCPVLLGATLEISKVEPLANEVGVRDTIRLAAFSDAEATEYILERFRRRVDPELTGALIQKSGGKPLFLRLLVDRAVEGVRPDDLPASDLEEFTNRLEIDRGTFHVLACAAVMEDRIEVDVLGDYFTGLEQALERAESAGVVDFDRTTNTATFIHGIVKQAALNYLRDGARLDVEEFVARKLTSLDRSAIESVQYVNAVGAAMFSPEELAEANLAAGIEYLDAHALEEAIAFFKKGREALPGRKKPGFEKVREVWVALTIRLGEAERLLMSADHVRTLGAAALEAKHLPDSSLFARAVTQLLSHNSATQAGQCDPRIRALLKSALNQDMEVADRAAVLAASSAFLALSAEYLDGQANFDEARLLVEDIDDHEVIASVYVHTHLGMSDPSKLDARDEAIARLESVAGNDVDLNWEVAYLRFWQAFRRGESAQMKAAVASMDKLVPRARHRELSTIHIRCALAQIHGQIDRAEEHREDAENVSKKMGFDGTWRKAHHSGIQFAIADAKDLSVAEVRDETIRRLRTAIDGFVKDLEEFRNWQAGKALLAFLHDKRPDRAKEALDVLAEEDFKLLSRDVSWTAAACIAARAIHLLDDVKRARTLFPQLVDFADEMSWAGTCTFGPVAWALQLLAETLGNHDDAVEFEKIAEGHFKRLGTYSHLKTERPQLI